MHAPSSNGSVPDDGAMNDIASTLEYEHAADAHAARAEHIRQLRETAAAGAKEIAIHESSLVYPLLILPFGLFLAYSGWLDRSTPQGLATGLRIVGPIIVVLMLMLLLRYTSRVLTLTSDGFVAGRESALIRWNDVTACEVVPGYAGPFTAFTAVKLFHRPGYAPPEQRAWGRIGQRPQRADGTTVTQISLFAKARLISEVRLFQLFDERIRAARAREELARLGI